MCPDCNHSEHDPGQCSNCNCGESELLELTPNSEAFSVLDECAQITHRGIRVVSVREMDYAWE